MPESVRRGMKILPHDTHFILPSNAIQIARWRVLAACRHRTICPLENHSCSNISSVTCYRVTASMAMTETRKRPSPAEPVDSLTGARAKKRQRTGKVERGVEASSSPIVTCKGASYATTVDELAKKGLRRGIALTLKRVGFGSATPDAMEGFVAMAEMCQSLCLAHS